MNKRWLALIIITTIAISIPADTPIAAQDCAEYTPAQPALILNHESLIYETHWLLDNTRILTESGDSVLLWDAASGENLMAEKAMTFRWNPQEDRLLLRTGNDLSIWDVNTGNKLFSIAEEGEMAFSSWSPDGSRISTTSIERGSLNIWDSQDGSHILRIQVYPSNRSYLVDHQGDWYVEWSSDGKSIYVIGKDNQIKLFDVDATSATFGDEIFRLNFKDYFPVNFKDHYQGYELISDVGRLLAWTASGELYIWDTDKDSPTFGVLIGETHQFAGWTEQFNSNWEVNHDRRVLLTWEDRVVNLWDIDTQSESFGKKMLTLEFEDPIDSPVWNSNSSRLAIRRDTEQATHIGIWNTDIRSETFGDQMSERAFTPLYTISEYFDLEWNRSGDRLLFFQNDPTPSQDLIFVVDGDTLNTLHLLTGTEYIISADWSPTASYIDTSSQVDIQGVNFSVAIDIWDISRQCKVFSFTSQKIFPGPIWSDDEKRVMMGVDETSVYVFDLPSEGSK